MQTETSFTFQNRDWNLLHNVLNEVLHGFGLKNVNAVLGMDPPALEELRKYLHDLPEKTQVTLDLRQTVAFRNALRETLRELGVEEFDTRTGYSFDEGQEILRRLGELTGSAIP